MGKIRFKFIRGEKVKYISHLDLMRTFERAIRRANIPVEYSKGFNPHPQIVFGLPLSVGVTSEAEYADIELEKEIEPDSFMQNLNLQLPEDLKITEAKENKSKANIMASIAFASYNITVSLVSGLSEAELRTKIKDFLNMGSIVVKKETKRAVRDVDIKPMISKLGLVDFKDTENSACISALLSAGSVANLKPELLIEALRDNQIPGLRFEAIHRTGLFLAKKDRMIEPLDNCVLSGLFTEGGSNGK